MNRMTTAELKAAAVAEICVFIDDRCVLHSNLVVPLTPLWRAYRTYCVRMRKHPMTAGAFVDALESLPRVTTREGGKGKLRKVAEGIGLKPEGD